MALSADTKNFFYQLLTTPSPSGHEQAAQQVVRSYMQGVADTINTDLHGNVICCINPEARRKVLLSGHVDQIGFLIRSISKEGFIYVSPVGGVDPLVLPGAQVQFASAKGSVIGVVGQKAIHLRGADERDKAKVDIEKLWIDIGAKSRAEAEKRVAIGDYGTLRLAVTELAGDTVSAPGIDNKAGVVVVMEAIRLLSKERLSVGVYAVSSVQEELGLRGVQTATFGIDPEVGIGVDVTHASDDPSNDGKRPEAALGSGAGLVKGPNVNPVVFSMLQTAAKKLRVAHTIHPHAKPLGNDTNQIQITRAGVAAGCVNIPLRNMHTGVEVVRLSDIEAAAKVIAGFIKSISAKTDFTPR